MKRIVLSMLMLIAVVGMAHASRVFVYDGICDPNSGEAHGGVGRQVLFYDPNGHCYYKYLVMCDGTVKETWYGSVGTIPGFNGGAVSYGQPTEQIAPNGDYTFIDYIYSGGVLIATLTYDGIEGHSVQIHPVQQSTPGIGGLPRRGDSLIGWALAA